MTEGREGGEDGLHPLETNARVPTADKVEEFVAVFADERLEVVASNIVPFDAIVVEVVEDRQARFVISLEIRI